MPVADVEAPLANIPTNKANDKLVKRFKAEIPKSVARTKAEYKR
jgi:hypothetical protein